MIKSRQDKAEVAIVTNFGPLQFEIWCHRAPKTCENFLELCQRKYYNDVPFHRLIKGFMLQGGDPTGTGKGGESYFGTQFEDECLDSSKRASHSQRGRLSMANKGRHTNGSQFFILFSKAEHLDGRHTVFGQLTSGYNILDKIEEIETDGADKPKQEVKITSTIVLSNPYRKTIAEILKKDWLILHKANQKEHFEELKKNELKRQKVEGDEIGKFMI